MRSLILIFTSLLAFSSTAFAKFKDIPHEKGSMHIASFLPLVLIIGLFYFLMIRPQMRRNKEHKQLLTNLKAGDEIVTTGGMIGKIAKVGDNFIEVSVADNLSIKVRKNAIASMLPKGSVKAD